MSDAPAAEMRPRAALARKTLHLSVALVPVAWAASLVDAFAVQVLFAAAAVVALAVEGARRASAAVQGRFLALVGSMLKPKERQQLTGATWLAIALGIAVLVLPPHAARVALWAGATGDAAAAVVGSAWQRSRGLVTTQKSWIGSAACMVLTAVGASWLGDVTPVAALLIGAAAALAEHPSRPGDDNLRVALVAGVAAWGLGI